MGAPTGIADQQVKACGDDHQQNGIDQACIRTLAGAFQGDGMICAGDSHADPIHTFNAV